MKALGVLVAIALLALGAWLSYELGEEVIALYGRSEAEVKLGVITAAGSALAFVINNAIQSSRERRARLFENKREAYDKFFELLFLIFTKQKSGSSLTDDQLVEKFQEFTRAVMTWGSANTINAVNVYQRSNLNNNVGDSRTLFASTEKLLRALRKDLGHADGALERLALTKLLLKADEHDKV